MPATAKAKAVFIIAPFTQTMPTLPQATYFTQTKAVGQNFNSLTLLRSDQKELNPDRYSFTGL
jgi:hypothetical protein